MLHANRVATMERFETKRTDAMEIDENELWILSYYRASELAGALVMGRLAHQTDDDDLRVHLTEHCAEEANHAWLWTQAILEVGGTPRRVAETYQSRYYAEIGPPTTVLEVLALTQVFERRVVRHFRDHLRRPETHPAVARTLRRMVAEEVGHIGWVKDRLDRFERETGSGAVAEVLRRFAEVDRKVYTGLLEYRDRFRELADPTLRSGQRIASSPGRGPESGAGRGRSRVAVELAAREFIARATENRPADIDPETPLGMLGVGSLDLVAIVAQLEEAFRVELSTADTECLYTLDDLIDTVTRVNPRIQEVT
jgi:acyl carrier protein/bacterioferritin (cytochrome b1)